MNLNEQAKVIHEANAKWWVDMETGLPLQRNKAELLVLVISEFIEALDGERKNLMDEKLPHRKMAEVEMADAYIRLLDYAAGFGEHIHEQPPQLVEVIADNKGEAIFNMILLTTWIEIGNPSWIEMVIAEIRAYCKKHGYDLDGAVAEKLNYNHSRIDHTHEARKLDNGKKF